MEEEVKPATSTWQTRTGQRYANVYWISTCYSSREHPIRNNTLAAAASFASKINTITLSTITPVLVLKLHVNISKFIHWTAAVPLADWIIAWISRCSGDPCCLFLHQSHCHYFELLDCWDWLQLWPCTSKCLRMEDYWTGKFYNSILRLTQSRAKGLCLVHSNPAVIFSPSVFVI